MKTYKKTFIGLWTIAIVLMLIIGIQEIRKQGDNQIARRLNAASNAITDYARAQKKLPGTLTEVQGIDTTGLDYKKLSETSYELCANFVTTVPGYRRSESASQIYVYAHDSGHQCFKAEPTSLKTSTRQTSTNIGTASIRARDTERQTDIKALHGQIEAYYAQNGRYPTLANMNNTTFRSSNMKGLDDDALKDPKNTMPILAAKPGVNIYSYAVTTGSGAQCDNVSNDCTDYTLTATLEAGGTYTKNSLN